MPLHANADTFAAGSYIIPMDLDYQDDGMFLAYGLVYDLLRQGVHVRWAIRTGKGFGEADFTTSATDVATGAAVIAHGYRAGPWVIDQSDAAAALPIITAWQLANPDTAVHQASAEFDSDVRLTLVVAPTIAMFADGNENIAREYMVAAQIPDSTLDFDWPDDSPDMLSVAEVSGASAVDHADGALFDADHDPVYCQFMSMHWGVNDAADNPEVVAEVREYLNFPTHFFAECQAVNAFENLEPYGFFLTDSGFEIGDQPDDFDFYNADTPFGQIDGVFESVGGSEPAYSLPPGGSYKAGGVVMISEQGTGEGVNDIWMTGFLDGECPPNTQVCNGLGKISYLGGHRYRPDLPISDNPDSQGGRLFLNSLFEAPCATEIGQPAVSVFNAAPAETVDPSITYQINYFNSGPGIATNATIAEAIPAGTTFEFAEGGGVFADGVVTWDLGNLGIGEVGAVSYRVGLPAYGEYSNSVPLDYRVGLNGFVIVSNTVITIYAEAFGGTDPATDTNSGTGDATAGLTEGLSAGLTDVGSASGNSGSATSGSGPNSASGVGSGDGTGGSGGGGHSGSGNGGVTGGDLGATGFATESVDAMFTTGGGDGDGGCACRSGGQTGPAWLAFMSLVGLGLYRRRSRE